jgi:hypothetical protein
MKESKTIALMFLLSGIAILLYSIQSLVLGPEIIAFETIQKVGVCFGLILIATGIYLHVKVKKED